MENLEKLLVGLAAGDGLGSTSEFTGQVNIPALYYQQSKYGWPFKQIGGGAFACEPGEHTDDTSMALCLYESFKEHGQFDPVDVTKRFVAWFHSRPKDMGGTTSRTLGAAANGYPWHECGLQDYSRDPNVASNGSLMRNGVVPGMATSLQEAFSISIKHGLITHYAPLPQLCCAAQSYLIWRLLEGREIEEMWQDAFFNHFLRWIKETKDVYVHKWLYNVKDRLPEAAETFLKANWDPHSFTPFGIQFIGRVGYCLLTLQIAVWALYWSLAKKPFETPRGFPEEPFKRGGPDVLGWVALVGYDSDTYAATAGPLIMAAHGSLPQDLIDDLHVWEKIQ